MKKKNPFNYSQKKKGRSIKINLKLCYKAKAKYKIARKYNKKTRN